MILKKLLLYPYDSNFTPVLRYTDLRDRYKITLTSPAGWGMEGIDAGLADGGTPVNVFVRCDFDSLLKENDVILFCASEKELDFKKFIFPKIIKAFENGKDVICTLKMDQDSLEALREGAKSKKVDFQYFGQSPYKHTYNAINTMEERLVELNTPVVLVAGLTERTSKFAIQLVLREKFMKLGYKVSQIGTRDHCEFLGFHSFPEFMFNNSVSESNKVVYFNHYLKKLEETEQPDVFIIGVPGGIMPFDNMYTNRFGILAYEVCQAVEPDVAVVSALFEEYLPEFFTSIAISLRYKLGFMPDCFNLANVVFDSDDSRNNNSLSFTTVNTHTVENRKKELSELQTPVFNILNNDDQGKMANLLIDKMAEYGNVTSAKRKITHE